MVTDTTQSPLPNKPDDATRKSKRRTPQYVSRHFDQPQAEVKTSGNGRLRKKRKVQENEKENVYAKGGNERQQKSRSRSKDSDEGASNPILQSNRDERAYIQTNKEKKLVSEQDSLLQQEQPSSIEVAKKEGDSRHGKHGKDGEAATGLQADVLAPDKQRLAPWQQVLAVPIAEQKTAFQRIFFGVNVDALSSDSDLTDVPEDVGPDPWVQNLQSSDTLKSRVSLSIKDESNCAGITAANITPKIKPKSKLGLTKSPYFPHAHKPRPTFLSTLPFPPLDLERFGLMQERLCHDPFRLLLATIFLNKTPGQRAMPIFFKLMEEYPTPEKLALAEQADVTAIIRELGFQNQRARKCIAMAKKWVEDPPVKGRRWRKPDYPIKGDGKNLKADEVVDDADERVAWEISHLPGLGPYSHDSWRMFCRDELREVATVYNGEGIKVTGSDKPFEPEWKRVLPTDKELRAWMTWMWMKEGIVWNKETGQRTRASSELMDLARGEGNVVLESEASTLVVKSLDEEKATPLKLPASDKNSIRIEAPAGDFIPRSV